MMLKTLIGLAWATVFATAAPVDDGRHCFTGVCKNGSVCKLNSEGWVYCANCPSAYTGNRCQTPKSNEDDGRHCYDGICKNGSICKLNAEGWVYCANCPAAYTGSRCQTPKSNADDGRHCFDGICKNGSTCKLNAEGWVYCANCPAAYTGSRCQTPKSNEDDGRHCFEGICRNGSTCKLNTQGWVYCANCPAAYTGNRCEKAVADPCTPSPCKNGSACSAGSNNTYFCSCADGYGGKNCENAPVACDATKGETSCGGYSGPSGFGADTLCCPSDEDCLNVCGATSCSRQCITKNRPKTCTPNPCLNGNPCYYFQAGPKCQCEHSETGLFCENKP